MQANNVNVNIFVVVSGYAFCLEFDFTFQNIEGEIYEVGDECLDFLDKLEHHPEFYTRLHTEVRVFTGSKKEGQIKQCSAYFLINFREHLLDLPMHACYTDGIDGKRFAFPSGWKTSARPLHEVHKDFEPPDC